MSRKRGRREREKSKKPYSQVREKKGVMSMTTQGVPMEARNVYRNPWLIAGAESLIQTLFGPGVRIYELMIVYEAGIVNGEWMPADCAKDTTAVIRFTHWAQEGTNPLEIWTNAQHLYLRGRRIVRDRNTHINDMLQLFEEEAGLPVKYLPESSSGYHRYEDIQLV